MQPLDVLLFIYPSMMLSEFAFVFSPCCTQHRNLSPRDFSVIERK